MQGIHKPRKNNCKLSQQASPLIAQFAQAAEDFNTYLSIPGCRMVDGDSQSRKQRKISIVSRLGGVGLHAVVGGSNLPLTEFIFGFPEFNSNVLGELPAGCPFSIKIQ